MRQLFFNTKQGQQAMIKQLFISMALFSSTSLFAQNVDCADIVKYGEKQFSMLMNDTRNKKKVIEDIFVDFCCFIF